MKDCLEFCLDVVREAGQVLLDNLHHVHIIKAKTSAIDLVTEADEMAQDIIVRHIRAAYPEHGIVAEEDDATSIARHEYVWFVDPIDGTTNYWHGMPSFCISMALCHHDEPQMGVIYAPYTNELFYAARGRGAFHNLGEMHVSSVKLLDHALVATGFPYHRAPGSDNNLVEFARVVPFVQGIRRCGSAALDLAYLAAGRFDGYWEFHVRPWDTMAGQILVLEAGGVISTIRAEGAMHGPGGILATNGHIHTELHRRILGDA
jgi:myo-inositol-1(or 4)-monophosphatase